MLVQEHRAQALCLPCRPVPVKKRFLQSLSAGHRKRVRIQPDMIDRAAGFPPATQKDGATSCACSRLHRSLLPMNALACEAAGSRTRPASEPEKVCGREEVRVCGSPGPSQGANKLANRYGGRCVAATSSLASRRCRIFRRMGRYGAPGGKAKDTSPSGGTDRNRCRRREKREFPVTLFPGFMHMLLMSLVFRCNTAKSGGWSPPLFAVLRAGLCAL